MHEDELLDVKKLRISFNTDEGLITPVEDVSFKVGKGKVLGIVGESGSGKSISTRALIKLLPDNAVIDPGSQILFTNKCGDIVNVSALTSKDKRLRKIRGGEIGMIFQEPMASFSPVYTIGNQITEAILQHCLPKDGSKGRISKQESKEIAIDMLNRVGISKPDLRFNQYPHELSGGMRQRAMIAVALCTSPSLLIADEPTTALDVTIQAQILKLLKELQQELGMATIFISHDMGVIANIADEVAVMYLGVIVESGSITAVIKNPLHPYTQGLLQAIPRIDQLGKKLHPISGNVPGPRERPRGCPFHPRCSRRSHRRCNGRKIVSNEVNLGHFVRCVHYQ